MSVDTRTRSDGPVAPVAPRDLFEERLPALFARSAYRLAPAVRSLAPAPLAVAVDDAAWTLAGDGERVRITCGNPSGHATLQLTGAELTDLAVDQVTPVGWFSSGRLRFCGAQIADLMNWWLLLRGALDDTTPHTPGAITLRAADGAPLDLQRTFTLDDDPAIMRGFLEQAGYLHVAGVFTAEEMGALSAEMDRAAAGYQPGDGRSWWARTADGVNRLVRMQRFDEASPVVAALVHDDRLQRFAALTGDGHQWGAMDGNNIEALFKPRNVVAGISDVPWHKDCSLGRHSYECSSLTAGISVTGGGPRSGQLRVVAGSHRALTWPALLRFQGEPDLPAIDLPTATGDLTIHLSCTLHMAQPPIDDERRVMYTDFRLPSRDAHAAAVARARLTEMREAAPTTVSQPTRGT